MHQSLRHATGRVVRWDAHGESGAVVVLGLAAEITVPASAVEANPGRALEPGELVEVTYAESEHGLLASRVCPTDAGE